MELTRRAFIATGIAGAAGAWGCVKCPPNVLPSSRRLVLDFYGLSAIVFSGSPTVMDVLMIDGLQTKLQLEHHARLRTDRKYIDSSNPTKETGEEKISFLEKQPFWDLKGHRITLEAAGASSLTRVAREPELPGPTPGNEASSQADLSWLARMSRIPAAGKGRINPQHLTESSTKIAARLRFTTGQASAGFRPPFQDVVWQIASPGSTAVERAIAHLILTVPITSNTITFNLEPIGGGPVKRVVLSPQSSGETRVSCRNVPDPHMCSNDSELRNLKHFEAFYELLTPEDQSGLTPFPVCPDSTCKLLCPDAAEPVYCPPTQYDPPPQPEP